MTPEQALAVIEQERMDEMAEGMTEKECEEIASYVLASAYRRLLAVAEGDGPCTHGNGCPLCIDNRALLSAISARSSKS